MDLPEIAGINAVVYVTKEKGNKGCVFEVWLWVIVLFVDVSHTISVVSHPQIMSQ